MIAVEDLPASGIEEAQELYELGVEAGEFLAAYKWCVRVKRGFYDRGFSKVAVFYFEIEATPPADSTVWVIVGDLPPAYIDTQSCPNGAAALDGYVGAVREWIDAVKDGRDTSGLIPVVRRGSLKRVEPTKEMAEMLASRMDFIDREILSQWPDEVRA